MKKDIRFPEVEGVLLAIARKEKSVNTFDWYVYLINLNSTPLENVMITSKGYGMLNGEKKNTSVLRHMIEKLERESFALVEPIDPALFSLHNEFWVSYYIKEQIYDKKFIFVPDSVTEENLSFVKELDLEGVVHG